MRRVQIDEFIKQCGQGLLLDVRSPGEYNHAHLPGAISFPLFTDEERKVVGTTYKQISREAAIKIGLDYFGPKMRSMVEEVEKLTVDRWPLAEGPSTNYQPSTVKLYLYCWRGGMRSGAVAWLLNLYGFNVTVLAGGYKAFRNWVIKTNAHPHPLQILGGYTGSGKTELLNVLQQSGEAVIDLEAIANHKGSAFGNIGMPAQPTQEMFENLLALQLARHAVAQKPIWVEDESQRIGQINLPSAFWQNMRRSPVYFLEIPFEERLKHILAEYGQLDKEKMIGAIQRIAKRLGPLETKTAIQFLEEGNLPESFRLLLHYYDKRYLKGLHNRENVSQLLTKISCEKVAVGNAVLVSQAQQASNYAGIL
ncbi:MAG: tRNA 2-selenouridine(34) synthase MnmH [Chitinophagaceae bacterium]|nr:MAG: tRNA 2-selenouridine(34) synthase MnmH [Chitinophagaceae bacterium]